MAPYRSTTKNTKLICLIGFLHFSQKNPSEVQEWGQGQGQGQSDLKNALALSLHAIWLQLTAGFLKAVTNAEVMGSAVSLADNMAIGGYDATGLPLLGGSGGLSK